MKKITLLLAAVVGAVTISTAQIRIAPEVGVSFNKMVMDPSSPNSGFAIGPRVGGLLDIKLNENLYLQPGIAWAMRGGKDEVLDIEAKTSIHYIDIPVNLMYKLGKEGSGRFFFGIGPNLSYALSGKTKVSGSLMGISFDEEADLTFGSDSTDLKAFDFGGNVNVGYELPMGLYARAFYQMGFANLSNDDASKVKNMSFGLSIGYFFGGNKGTKSAAAAQ